MKKNAILSTFILFVSIASLNAQTVGSELKAYIRQQGYSISSERYAYLSEGETASYTKTFYSGTSYGILAYTEESGVQDIDIYLYDDDGSLLVKDTDSDRSAVVEYTPYVTRQMRVVIKNYNSYSPSTEYKCKFIVAYSN